MNEPRTLTFEPSQCANIKSDDLIAVKFTALTENVTVMGKTFKVGDKYDGKVTKSFVEILQNPEKQKKMYGNIAFNNVVVEKQIEKQKENGK